MIIFPAIDLRAGRCVRLFQGDPGAETVFGEDPVAVAQHWVEEGATWLHIVNLDGALGDDDASRINMQALKAILRNVQAHVQFGGGLRTLDDMARLLDLGVDRVILGTAAVQDSSLIATAVARFGPEQIMAGIDARNGRVAIRGWRETTGVQALALAHELQSAGIERIVYTDITRDGTMTGPNLDATIDLAHETGLKVIASGGISSMADLLALYDLMDLGIEGAIIGQALYTRAIDLRTALAAVQTTEGD